MVKFEVVAKYAYTGSLAKDHNAIAAAQRCHDSAGIRSEKRDLAWVCETEVEALKIKVALRDAGFSASVRRLMDCVPLRGWSS